MMTTHSAGSFELDLEELPAEALLAAESIPGNEDDDRDDEGPDENEIPVGEVDEATEAPEEFESDDEDELDTRDDADDADDEELDDD